MSAPFVASMTQAACLLQTVQTEQAICMGHPYPVTFMLEGATVYCRLKHELDQSSKKVIQTVLQQYQL